METYAYFCEYFMSDYNLLVSVRILTLLQMQFFFTDWTLSKSVCLGLFH